MIFSRCFPLGRSLFPVCRLFPVGGGAVFGVRGLVGLGCSEPGFGEVGSAIKVIAVVGRVGRIGFVGVIGRVGRFGWIGGGFVAQVGWIGWIGGIGAVGRFGVGLSRFGSVGCQVQDRPKKFKSQYFIKISTK